jgi:hypothetical protein
MSGTIRTGVSLLAISLALAACGDEFAGRESVVGIDAEALNSDRLNAYDRGKAYMEAGQIGLAVQSFRRALRENPERVDSLNALAIAYERLGRNDLAERYFTEALSVQPRSAQTLNNLGFFFARQGKYDIAISFLERANDADGADRTILANLELMTRAREDQTATLLADIEVMSGETPLEEPRKMWIERTSRWVQTLVFADASQEPQASETLFQGEVFQPAMPAGAIAADALKSESVEPPDEAAEAISAEPIAVSAEPVDETPQRSWISIPPGSEGVRAHPLSEGDPQTSYAPLATERTSSESLRPSRELSVTGGSADTAPAITVERNLTSIDLASIDLEDLPMVSGGLEGMVFVDRDPPSISGDTISSIRGAPPEAPVEHDFATVFDAPEAVADGPEDGGWSLVSLVDYVFGSFSGEGEQALASKEAVFDMPENAHLPIPERQFASLTYVWEEPAPTASLGELAEGMPAEGVPAEKELASIDSVPDSAELGAAEEASDAPVLSYAFDLLGKLPWAGGGLESNYSIKIWPIIVTKFESPNLLREMLIADLSWGGPADDAVSPGDAQARDARIAPRNFASVTYVFEDEGVDIAVPLKSFASLNFALHESRLDEDARIAPRNLASVTYVFEDEGVDIAAEAPAVAPGTVGYWVQIGSFRTPDDALHHGDELARNHEDLFADLGVEVKEADLGPERGVYFRTVSQRLGLSNARELCRALLAREVDCFVDGPRIEIANGVGRLETAAHLDLYLEAKGVYVGALTNDARFDHEATVIFYSEGFEGEAAALARLLPFEAALEPVSMQAADIRVRLGSDMLGFERALAALSRGEAA